MSPTAKGAMPLWNPEWGVGKKDQDRTCRGLEGNRGGNKVVLRPWRKPRGMLKNRDKTMPLTGLA